MQVVLKEVTSCHQLNFCLRLACCHAALQPSTSLAAVGWFFPLGIPRSHAPVLRYSGSMKDARRCGCAQVSRTCSDAQLYWPSVCTLRSTSSISIGRPPDVGTHIYILSPFPSHHHILPSFLHSKSPSFPAYSVA
ncbi:hypothetical protein QQF64_017025 [Cirrhinus molitorella]|uniref:Uncharacterized protein n=1 Tax=Cirrhinus molitorella TaxID=172907 RepID=A0ABR3LHG9_9TELE